MPKVDYNRYMVRKPVYEIAVDAVGKGHQISSMTYMSNPQVPGSNTYIEISWIYDVPEPNPYVFEHAHNYDELILHIGSDPKNPESLGGEVTIEMEGQPLSFDTTTALFVPAGTKHGPLTWQKVTRPHLEMTVMLGCGDFKLANPGRNPGQ